MTTIKASNARVEVVCHEAFGGLAYSCRSDRKGQFGCVVLDSHPLGPKGEVVVADIAALAGIPELAFANNRPQPQSIVSGLSGGVMRTISIAPYGSNRVAAVSAGGFTWMMNNWAITIGQKSAGMSHSDRSTQSTAIGNRYIAPLRVTAKALKSQPGAKRAFLSIGQHESWDKLAPIRETSKKHKLLPPRNCQSMHHIANQPSVPAVHGARIFGKQMCERCFERAINQTQSQTDMQTLHGQIHSSQTATDLLEMVTPAFKIHLKRVLTKFQWWMAIACLDAAHFAAPTRVGGKVSLEPMELHAAAIKDHPHMFGHVYRMLQYALAINPHQPVMAIRQQAVATCTLPDEVRAVIALHGYVNNRTIDDEGGSHARWVPKNRSVSAASMRWVEPDNIVHPHVGMLIVTVQSGKHYVITRECARVIKALMTGELVLSIMLAPALPAADWRSMNPTARMGKHLWANKVPPFRVGLNGCHGHAAPYLNAEELSWDKLYGFLKHHIDLANATTPANIPTLNLAFAGSLSLAAARVRRTYGNVAVTTGSVFEQLVEAALLRVTRNITVDHGEFSDPLAYTGGQTAHAAAALGQEISMLRADPAVVGRFGTPSISLNERYGNSDTHEIDCTNHTTAADRAELWTELKEITYASENNNGNLGKDKHTRKISGVARAF
jgi:hypothetical protein